MPDYLVIIPSRNRYELVLRAVRSVLKQTVPPAEVVVIDDASDDRRYDWLDEIISNPRFTLLREKESSRQQTSSGFAVGSVRNRGLLYAKQLQFDGWIAFLDDDDEWFPTKMERQFEAAVKYDEVYAFCTNAFNRNPSGLVCGYHHGPHGRELSHGYRDVTQCLREFNPVINSTATLHSKVAWKVGLQAPSGYGEDWDYWRRTAILTPVIRLEEPLAFYTIGNTKEYELPCE
jgi:glycosyltransferase involved in cell wall biosynthesis